MDSRDDSELLKSLSNITPHFLELQLYPYLECRYEKHASRCSYHLSYMISPAPLCINFAKTSFSCEVQIHEYRDQQSCMLAKGMLGPSH